MAELAQSDAFAEDMSDEEEIKLVSSKRLRRTTKGDDSDDTVTNLDDEDYQPASVHKVDSHLNESNLCRNWSLIFSLSPTLL